MRKMLVILFMFAATALFAAQSDREIEHLEKQLIELINKERKKEGLSALKEWTVLTKIARKHSQNMAAKKVAFGHDGFDDRFDESRKKGSVKKFGENVAYSYNVKNPLQTAVQSWMNSSSHRKNILNKEYTETGIGIAYDKKGKFFVTQLFSKRTKSS